MFLFPIPILHLPKTISLKPFNGYQWLLGYRIRPKLLSPELETLIPDPMYHWIFFRTCSVLWYLHVLTCKVLFQLILFFPHSPPVKYSAHFSSPLWNLPPLWNFLLFSPLPGTPLPLFYDLTSSTTFWFTSIIIFVYARLWTQGKRRWRHFQICNSSNLGGVHF